MKQYYVRIKLVSVISEPEKFMNMFIFVSEKNSFEWSFKKELENKKIKQDYEIINLIKIN